MQMRSSMQATGLWLWTTNWTTQVWPAFLLLIQPHGSPLLEGSATRCCLLKPKFVWTLIIILGQSFVTLCKILGTMLLLLCICAITDKKNTQIPSALVPMYVGFTILGIGVCFGANCGYALNPARDLSPRIISLIAGWEQSFRWSWVDLIIETIDFTWFFKYLAGTTTIGFGYLLLALILELSLESLFTSRSLKPIGQRMEMNWYPRAFHGQISTKNGVRRSRTWIWRVRS